MSRPSVFVTLPLSEERLIWLKERCQEKMNSENRYLINQELLERIEARMPW